MSDPRRPLLDILIEEIKARGFYPYESETIDTRYTLWTHVDWQNWWQSSGRELAPWEEVRKERLIALIASIVGEESGWDALTFQDMKEDEST